MKLKEKYMLTEVVDEYILFPIGQEIVDYSRIMTVNDTGKFILEQLENEITYDDLLQAMVIKYKANEDEVHILKEDLDEFLAQLNADSIIVNG